MDNIRKFLQLLNLLLLFGVIYLFSTTGFVTILGGLILFLLLFIIIVAGFILTLIQINQLRKKERTNTMLENVLMVAPILNFLLVFGILAYNAIS